MDIYDQRIRSELAARIEVDPMAVSYVRANAWQGCWTVVVVLASFACGVAIGSSLFHQTTHAVGPSESKSQTAKTDFMTLSQ